MSLDATANMTSAAYHDVNVISCLYPAYILHSGIAGEGETMRNENSGPAGEADSPNENSGIAGEAEEPNENSGLAGEAEEPKHQDRTNFARRMRGHKHVD